LTWLTIPSRLHRRWRAAFLIAIYRFFCAAAMRAFEHWRA
jgi:hypothetical protein